MSGPRTVEQFNGKILCAPIGVESYSGGNAGGKRRVHPDQTGVAYRFNVGRTQRPPDCNAQQNGGGGQLKCEVVHDSLLVVTLLLFGVVASWRISPKIAPTPIPETTSMQNGAIS
jgi:hypothetical protein